jgi:chromosome segregation ATPase
LQIQKDKFIEDEKEHERCKLELENAIRKEDEDSDVMTAKYSKIQEQIKEITSILEEKEKMKADLQSIISQQSLVSSEQENVKGEIDEIKAKIEADVATIVKLQTEQTELTLRKHANDRNEVEGIIPARAELDELEKERTKLDSFLEQLKTNLSGDVSESRINLEKLEREINVASKEVELQENVAAEYYEQLREAERSCDSMIRSLEKTKEQSLEQRNNIEEQIQKKKEEIMDLEKQADKYEEQDFQFLKKKLELLQKGKRVLNKTEAKVKNLLEGNHKSSHNKVSIDPQDKSKSTKNKAKKYV